MFIGSNPLQRGGSPIYQPIGDFGRLAEGLYISDSIGNLTYVGSDTSFEGVTENSSYIWRSGYPQLIFVLMS